MKRVPVITNIKRPDDLKSFLVYKLFVLAVVLAILVKLVVILKLGLRNISKRITSLIF